MALAVSDGEDQTLSLNRASTTNCLGNLFVVALFWEEEGFEVNFRRTTASLGLNKL